MGNPKAPRGTRWPRERGAGGGVGGEEGLANPDEEKRLEKALEGELRHFPRGERGSGGQIPRKSQEGKDGG